LINLKRILLESTKENETFWIRNRTYRGVFFGSVNLY
jgi:hypothetical protein